MFLKSNKLTYFEKIQIFLKTKNVSISLTKEDKQRYFFEMNYYPPFGSVFFSDELKAIEFHERFYKNKTWFSSRMILSYFSLLKRNYIPNVLKFKVGVHSSINKKEFKRRVGALVYPGRGAKIKIFNFKRRKVINILRDQNFSRYFANEIEVRNKLSKNGCAFKIGRVGKNYFEEDLVEISRFALRPKDYILGYAKLCKFYTSQEIGNRKILSFGLSPKICKAIHTLGVEHIPIVFSHGDFWKGNIIKGQKGIFLIDWEYSRETSFLYDYFNFLIVDLYKRHAFNNLLEVIYKRKGYREKLNPLYSRLLNQLETKLNIKVTFGLFLTSLILFLHERQNFHERLSAIDLEHKGEVKKYKKYFEKVIETL